MNRRRNLFALRAAFSGRLSRLERRFAASSGHAIFDRDPVISYVTIEALNSWAQFSKAFYLSCSISARTEANISILVSPTGLSENDAIGRAITIFKPYAAPAATGMWARRDEPTWHDPNVLLKVCGDINCSLYAHMQNAFSMGQNVFIDLPVLRNFYGHRNRASEKAAQNVGPKHLLPSSLRPSELLAQIPPRASSPLLLEFIAEMRITAEFLCQ
jgi:hypothetical protein